MKKDILNVLGYQVSYDNTNLIEDDQKKSKAELMDELQELRQRLRLIEKAYRQSETRYQALADLNSVAIWQTGFKDQKTIYINQAMRDIIGIDSDIPLDQINLYDFATEESQKRIHREDQEKRLQGESSTYEIEISNKNGSTKSVLVSGAPIFAHNGEVTCTSGTVIDISERKQAETALKESEEKYRQVVENAHEGIIIVQDNLIKFVNRKSLEMSGYSEEELINRPFTDFVHEEDRQKVELNYQNRVKGRQIPQSYSFRMNNKDKQTQWLDITIAATVWKKKPGHLIFGTNITKRKEVEEQLQKYQQNLERLVDERTEKLAETNLKLYTEVIERKRIENELRQSQKYTQYLIDSSLDMIISVDIKRNIVEFNNAAQKTFGYSKKEAIGKNVNILYQDPDIDGKMISQELKQKRQFVGEINNRRKDGSIFPTFISSSLILDNDGDPIGAMGISRDISQRKANEKLLSKLTSEIHSSIKNKLESAKLFLADGKSRLNSSLDDAKYCFNIAEKLIAYVTTVSKNMLFVTTHKECSIEKLCRELELRADSILVNARIRYEIDSTNIDDQIVLQAGSIEYILEVYTELLNNIAKHSYAGNAWITISMIDSNIELLVEDNGIGFNYNEKINKEDSYGLDIIENLALENKTNVIYESKLGEGTLVKTVIKR